MCEVQRWLYCRVIQDAGCRVDKLSACIPGATIRPSVHIAISGRGTMWRDRSRGLDSPGIVVCLCRR